MEVDILMATYNGASYLHEQIDSIISQTHQSWHLYVRDDGSTDDTLKILENYSSIDSRIFIINDNKGHLNVAANFSELLLYSEAEYIMFADQDDIWFNDKIEKSLNYIIEKEGPERHGMLIFCNSILVDSNNEKKIGTNYPSNFESSIRNFMFSNAGYQGAAIMFNRTFYQKIFPFFPNCIVHDYHISLIGLFLSNVSFLNIPLLYYRRHLNSTTKVNATLISRIKSVIRRQPKIFIKDMIGYVEQFRDFHAFQIPQDKLYLIDTYLKIFKSSNRLRRLSLAHKAGFKLRGSKLYLYFKLMTIK